ncbi:MAG: hypothetical protein JJU40_11125 [Rhodobacteraceae bacterium]|nr:hypothetical protein [Paracoccaceae bacterium]
MLLLAPLRDMLRAQARGAAGRAATVAATAALAAMASVLLLAGGLVALADAVGFPLAALVFAAMLAALALAVHLLGRVQSARRARQAATARQRAEADIALGATLARSAGPLLPLAAFVAAFALMRRP